MSTKQLFLRGVSFIALITAWYFGVWQLGIVLLLWQVYHYRAYECIMLGILIDAQFMSTEGIPWYTVGFSATVLLAELLKPLLRPRKTSLL